MLESHNISDLYFTIFALPIMFDIVVYIHYSCIISYTEWMRSYKETKT